MVFDAQTQSRAQATACCLKDYLYTKKELLLEKAVLLYLFESELACGVEFEDG